MKVLARHESVVQVRSSHEGEKREKKEKKRGKAKEKKNNLKYRRMERPCVARSSTAREELPTSLLPESGGVGGAHSKPVAAVPRAPGSLVLTVDAAADASELVTLCRGPTLTLGSGSHHHHHYHHYSQHTRLLVHIYTPWQGRQHGFTLAALALALGTCRQCVIGRRCAASNWPRRSLLLAPGQRSPETGAKSM